MAADEFVVYRSSNDVHARRADVRSSHATARRRRPSRPRPVHPRSPGRCPRSVPPSLQPGRLVDRAVCRRRPPGLPRRRGLVCRSSGRRSNGPLPVGACRRPCPVPPLLLRRRVRYVTSRYHCAETTFRLGGQKLLHSASVSPRHHGAI